MLKNILFLALLLPFFCNASEDRLNRDDIHKVMKQIFSQHVDQKSMNGQILSNSFKVYLEQFDPEGIYLLQSDVAPYIKMTPQQLDQLDKKYAQSNYSTYEEMNQMIAKAIRRARALRKEVMKNPKNLLKEALNSPIVSENASPSTYALNEKELQERTHRHLVKFLQLEIKHFGEKRINGFEPQALALYENELRDYEDQYTFTDKNGQKLSSTETENLFTLHILKAIAKSLDAHTAFFDNQEAYDMRVRLEKGFEGIGIAFQPSPQGVMVASLIKDGPAEKEGRIKVGDLLTSVNGTKTADLPFEKTMQLLKGNKDDPVHLSFIHPNRKESGKTIDVVLKRDTIVLNEDRVDVTSERFGDGIIGRITLHSFYQNDKGITSEKDVRDAILKLKSEGHLRGLILDLRENSGGFLSQAVKVAGLFITNGVIVISKYSNGTEKVYRDMDGRVDYSGPLIVLTSRATASAAEIVAEALQDYGVALIVGDEQTYGKGTIQSQTVTNNRGGSYFKVTVGKYYTVSGKTPQLGGVKADIVVPGPYSKVHLGEEYLDHTLSNQDQITPAFNDALKDIDPAVKPWYFRYYMPTLQKKNLTWKEEIPQLKTNSQKRLDSNKNYQAFLTLLNPKEAESLKNELNEEEPKEKNFGNNDLQLSEAFNILKDMITLAPKVRQKEYMVESEHSPKE